MLCRDLEACLIGTIENGSNNSVLLLGPRGCGKTMVLLLVDQLEALF